MALEALVSSDWHFEGMLKSLGVNSVDKQILEVRKVFEYAVEHGIQHVFVPGDVTDKPTMSDRTLITLISLLLEFDNSLHVYMLYGNHDTESVNKTSLDVLKVLAENGFFKQFKLFRNPETIKVDGINVCMMPYPHQKVLKSAKPQLVFAHIETAGAVGDNGRELRVHEDKFIRQEGDYVISGHIHQHQVLRAKRFTYCGSLFQRNFGEALPKGFIKIVAKYSGGELKVIPTFINSHPNFILETKLITEQSDWETLVQDENIRYKILVGDGITVPRDVTREFPNIVYLNSSSSRTTITTDGQNIEGGVTIKDLPTFRISTGLSNYLKQSTLERAGRNRAKALVKEAMSALNIN